MMSSFSSTEYCWKYIPLMFFTWSLYCAMIFENLSEYRKETSTNGAPNHQQIALLLFPSFLSSSHRCAHNPSEYFRNASLFTRGCAVDFSGTVWRTLSEGQRGGGNYFVAETPRFEKFTVAFFWFRSFFAQRLLQSAHAQNNVSRDDAKWRTEVSSKKVWESSKTAWTSLFLTKATNALCVAGVGNENERNTLLENTKKCKRPSYLQRPRWWGTRGVPPSLPASFHRHRREVSTMIEKITTVSLSPFRPLSCPV